MTSRAVEFYLRHRSQISEWAALEKRVDDLMRDAVAEGDQARAIELLKGESRDAEVDFYVRNRQLITEWDSLQAAAGQALHDALLAAAREAGCDAWEGKGGWSEALVRSLDFDSIREEHKVSVLMAWNRQHLLSTRRGYPLPRLALHISRDEWKGERRDRLVKATRPAAHGLGMKRRYQWWVHWGMLEPLNDPPDLGQYAEDCVSRLQEASRLLFPLLLQEISGMPGQS